MIERKEILQTLMSIDDINELRLIKSAIVDKIEEISSRIKYDLILGDKVWINSKRLAEEGIIKKINRTRAVVEINNKQWNVPFSMITKL